MKFDEYEKDLLESITKTDTFERVDDFEQELVDAKLAVKNYLNKTRNINIRITENDFLMLKRQSAKNNIPYQTLVSSLIHKYSNNELQVSV
jgi:predicted DNA binding CopG/RHH family protein